MKTRMKNLAAVKMQSFAISNKKSTVRAKAQTEVASKKAGLEKCFSK